MIHIANFPLWGFTFSDLFAGMGGFRVAFESLGAKCVFSCENNTFAKETYWINFKELTYDDIYTIPMDIVPDHDIMCAGFPPETISLSALGRNINEIRDSLFFATIRYVQAKRPKVVFLDNLYTLYSSNCGNTHKVIKNTFEKIGYVFYSKLLNSMDYGLPLNRLRVYMIAIRKDVNIREFEFPKPIPLTSYLEDYLLPDSETEHLVYKGDGIRFIRPEPESYVKELYKIAEYSSGRMIDGRAGEKIFSPKGLASTIGISKAKPFTYTDAYLINGKIRTLHPRECARILGYPDSFKLNPDTKQAYIQLANSVVVDIAKLIGNEVAKALDLSFERKIPDNH